MDVVLDIATIAVIGFIVVVAAGALLRREPRLDVGMIVALGTLLAVGGLMQLLPTPAAATSGDQGSAAKTSTSSPQTSRVEPRTSAPQDRSVDLGDFLARGEGGASKNIIPLTAENVCEQPTEWTFDLGGRYRTIEFAVQLIGTAERVPDVILQAAVDGHDLGTAHLVRLGESETLTLAISGRRELLLRTTSAGAVDCPDLRVRWSVLRIQPD